MCVYDANEKVHDATSGPKLRGMTQMTVMTQILNHCGRPKTNRRCVRGLVLAQDKHFSFVEMVSTPAHGPHVEVSDRLLEPLAPWPGFQP